MAIRTTTATPQKGKKETEAASLLALHKKLTHVSSLYLTVALSVTTFHVPCCSSSAPSSLAIVSTHTAIIVAQLHFLETDITLAVAQAAP